MSENDFYFDDKLLEPLNYLIRIPGKKIRSKLIESFNHWLHIPKDKLDKITDIIELLHNSSLLIDDIEDHSPLRRGMPVSHAVYGIPLTINCANYAYFIALKKCIDLDNAKAVKIFSDQLIELHRGQGMEIWFRDNFICPSEQEYLSIIQKKTGGLFKLAVLLMKCYSEDTRDFDCLIESIGLFFQIRDDLANLKSKEYSDSKSFCEDITEGKFSYPMIKYFQSDKDHCRLLDILRKRTEDVNEKKEVINMLEMSGCFKKTNEKLLEIKSVMFAELKKFGGNKYLELILSELCKIVEEV
ncbi:unnamed protein product [Brachionus calyciflorus]|uniref:Geranylgeranyl pyrophosphate synthase n=1 Tax=Brachionus calyciflorus TaxID=104777 RepID=A0A813Y6L1_9BILA|nr:unnamed protein product [Brachionus calyciflorus]